MQKQTVRLSFDVPIEEHIFIKTECIKSRMAMRDFLHIIVKEGMKAHLNSQFKQEIEEAFQDSYNGKGHPISFEELDRMEKELDK